jgi:hypothetical protein
VIDRARRRSLGAEDQRRDDIVDVYDVPQVLAAADHREAPRLAQTAQQLLGIPPARAVDVGWAHHHRRQARLQHEALALLLGAAVGGADGQRLGLAQQRPAGIAGDHGRGEDDPRRPLGALESSAGVDQALRARDVDLAYLRRAALRGDLRGEVDDALRLGLAHCLPQPLAIAEIPRHGLAAWRL